MRHKNHTEKSTFNSVNTLLQTASNLHGNKYLELEELAAIHDMYIFLIPICNRLRKLQEEEISD